MKRYLAFYGDQYYPRGGWEDLYGVFDTVQEALVSVEAAETADRKYVPHRPQWSNVWAHIVDSTTGNYVWDNERGHVTDEAE